MDGALRAVIAPAVPSKIESRKNAKPPKTSSIAKARPEECSAMANHKLQEATTRAKGTAAVKTPVVAIPGANASTSLALKR